MKDRLNNFLLATLWLSASTLVACFWFNIRFGFNLFSSAHWRHLAYMQASQNPVAPAFYISMVMWVILVMLGLHLLIRPRFKKLKMPIRNLYSRPKKRTSTPQPPTPAPAQTPTPTPEPTPAPQTDTPGLSRPPRLNISVTPQLYSAPTPTPQSSTTSGTSDWPEIREIFESTGYTLKPTPKIDNLQTSLFAIGTNETLWIGAVGVPTSAMQSAIDTISQIFSDTLDDIIINVTGFVVSPPDMSAPSAPQILTFDTPGALRQYMNEHKNPPLGTEDIENFDAFSAYISTVIDYIGKI